MGDIISLISPFGLAGRRIAGILTCMSAQISTCLQESLAPWLQISVASERRHVNIQRKAEDGSYEYISMAAQYVRNLLYINSGVVSLWGDILSMHLNTGECKLETLVWLVAEEKEEDVPYYSNLYRSLVSRFLSARIFGLSPIREWSQIDTPETMLRLAPFDEKFVYEIIYNRYGYEDYLFRKTYLVE